MNLETMPTPAIQKLQEETLNRLQIAWDKVDEDTINAANTEYDRFRDELIRRLGNDVHCSSVDPDLFSAYSDCWKDRYNFRPKHHVTYSEVKAWFENIPPLPDGD